MLISANVVLVVFACIFRSHLKVVDWLSFIQVILSVLLVSKINRDWLSVYNVFIGLIYLFNFGQAVNRILFPNGGMATNTVLAKTSEHLVMQAELFAMLCIFAITVGYVLTHNKKKRIGMSLIGIRDSDSFSKHDLTQLKSMSWIVLAVSVLPMAYIDFAKILSLSSGSYQDTYQVYQHGIGKYLSFIGQFGKPALCLLIFSYHKEKRKATAIFFLVNLYLLLAMLSGDRSTQLVYLITNLLIYAKFVRKPKFRTIVLGVLAVYFGLGFLSALSIFRYSEFSIQSFLAAFLTRRDQGILFNSLREYGGSLVSLVHSIDYIPRHKPFNCGLTYLESLLFISPVLPQSIVDAVNTSISFVHAFPDDAADFISLGGSCLGELYFNFGWISPFFALVIGSIVKRVDNGLNYEFDLRKAAIIIVLLPSMILWVRDFFVKMVFMTFWLSILIFCFVRGKNEKSTDHYDG